MSKQKKFVYVKFKFNEKFGLPEGFIVSEDEARVTAWPEKREVKSGNLDKPATLEESRFYGFFVDILNWYEKFRNSTLFIMSSLSIFQSIEYDVNIRKFVEAHGEKVESENSTHFRLDFSFAEELNKKLVESNRLSESIDFFPAFIFIG